MSEEISVAKRGSAAWRTLLGTPVPFPAAVLRGLADRIDPVPAAK